MVWFSFFGGIVQGAVAPVVNALTLVACIYSVVSISGAHVNGGWLTPCRYFLHRAIGTV